MIRISRAHHLLLLSTDRSSRSTFSSVCATRYQHIHIDILVSQVLLYWAMLDDDFKKFQLSLSLSLPPTTHHLIIDSRARTVRIGEERPKKRLIQQQKKSSSVHTFFFLFSPALFFSRRHQHHRGRRRFLGSTSLSLTHSHTFFAFLFLFFFPPHLSTGLTGAGRIESKDINFNPISLWLERVCARSLSLSLGILRFVKFYTRCWPSVCVKSPLSLDHSLSAPEIVTVKLHSTRQHTTTAHSSLNHLIRPSDSTMGSTWANLESSQNYVWNHRLIVTRYLTQ